MRAWQQLHVLPKLPQQLAAVVWLAQHHLRGQPALSNSGGRHLGLMQLAAVVVGNRKALHQLLAVMLRMVVQQM
jgi:hypothetical protein